MKRVLAVIHQPLYPVYRGDNRRILSICRAFAADGFTVDLLEMLESAGQTTAKEGQFECFTEVTTVLHPAFDENQRTSHESIVTEEIAQGLDKGLVSLEFLPFSFRQAVRQKLWQNEYDGVLVFNSECLPAVLPTPSTTKLIFIPGDIIFQLWSLKKDSGLETNKNLNQMAQEEVSFYRYCDLIAPTSQNDADVIAKYYSGPMAVAPISVEKVPFKAEINEGPPQLLFVGSGYDMNQQALTWFIEKVWPGILQKFPDCQLNIAGSVSEMVNPQTPNIILHGIVDDLQVIYEKAHIVISPIQIPTGIYIKNIEAMAYGKALVGTSASDHGLQAAREKALIIADTPEEFEAAVLSLLTDRGKVQQLAQTAHSYAQKHFSPKVVFKELLQKVKDLPTAQRPQQTDNEVPSFSAESVDKVTLKVEHYVEMGHKLGWQKVALYGAGKHSRRLLAGANWGNLKPAFIVDDSAHSPELLGIPVKPLAHLLEEKVDAVILSSDTFEKEMLTRVKSLQLDSKTLILTLYGSE